MIGQEKLINQIDKLTLDTFPHSTMLVGDLGSGKHTICDYITNKFGLPKFDITDKISQETIEEIYTKVEPIFYIIDISNISVKDENVILKFVEEPLKNAFIIFLCTNKSLVIPTILNRCQVWELARYSIDTLKQLVDIDNELLYNIFDTPGKLLIAKEHISDIDAMFDMSKKIVQYIGKANFYNTLTIPDKICFKDEKGKWDLDLFLSVLHYVISQSVINNKDNVNYFSLYISTNNLIKDITTIPHINKRQRFESYLYEARQRLANG